VGKVRYHHGGGEQNKKRLHQLFILAFGVSDGRDIHELSA
jgi:hypothetical protein